MYERMYGILFNAITDSLKQLEGFNYGLAICMLKEAQRKAEEVYMGKEDPDPQELADAHLAFQPTEISAP